MTTGGVGLITGLNISTVVSDLMTVADQPVTALQTQNTNLTNEQTAYDTLMSDLLGVQNDAKSLQQASLYNSRTAASNDTSALSATVTGTPALGTYTYTPLQVAQAEQLISNGLPSETSSVGTGTFTFGFGGNLNPSVSLDSLNGGNGFVPGEIKITDSSGATATINLSTAQTIGDVLNDINDNGTVNVTAVADGGRIDLIDNTGGSGSLKVQEVDGGSTAASLGLAGVDVAATKAAGSNVFTATGYGSQILSLSSNLNLNVLNDGAGVSTSSVLPDIGYTPSATPWPTATTARSSWRPSPPAAPRGPRPPPWARSSMRSTPPRPASLPRQSIRPTTGSSSPIIRPAPTAGLFR
jgi:flagellar hook-associated protein 2